MGLALDTVSLLPLIPSLGYITRTHKVIDVIKQGDNGINIYRQGKFSTENFEGNHIKGKQWAKDNPLSTPNYSKKYGLPKENTGRPDWIIKGKHRGFYSYQRSPPGYNNPLNDGGATEILPPNSEDVILEWFHMP